MPTKIRQTEYLVEIQEGVAQQDHEVVARHADVFEEVLEEARLRLGDLLHIQEFLVSVLPRHVPHANVREYPVRKNEGGVRR